MCEWRVPFIPFPGSTKSMREELRSGLGFVGVYMDLCKHRYRVVSWRVLMCPERFSMFQGISGDNYIRVCSCLRDQHLAFKVRVKGLRIKSGPRFRL